MMGHMLALQRVHIRSPIAQMESGRSQLQVTSDIALAHATSRAPLTCMLPQTRTRLFSPISTIVCCLHILHATPRSLEALKPISNCVVLTGSYMTTCKVVIIGGGFAGIRALLLLRKAGLQCTLVDEKNYTEFTPGILRALVHPELAAALLVEHKQPDILPGRRAIQIKPTADGLGGHVLLDDGSRLVWDYLVIATGSSYTAPIKPITQSTCVRLGTLHNSNAHQAVRQQQQGQHMATTHGSGLGQQCNGTSKNPADPDGIVAKLSQVAHKDRLAALHAAAAQIHSASSVIIVGGGPVGVELAAEIAGAYGRRKTVTLVTADARLLPRMAPAAGRYALRWLQHRGVHVLPSTRVTSWPQGAVHGPIAGEITTSTTTTPTTISRLSADLIYNCTGLSGSLNVQLYCDLIQGQDGASAAPDAQRTGIPVNSYMQVLWPIQPGKYPNGTHPDVDLVCAQVSGFLHIFAAGDVANTPWERSAYSADLQASCVATNILRCIRHQPLLPFPEGCLLFPVCPGLQRQPVMEVVSLYKHQAIMQVSRTCVCGTLPAYVKSLVQYMQLQLADGDQLATVAWLCMEALSTVLTACLSHYTDNW